MSDHDGNGDPIADCLGALEVLYYPQNHDQNTFRKANEYLMNFAKKSVAWEVTIQILMQDDLDSKMYFFAASTLRGKVLMDWEDLQDTNERMTLRDTMLDLLRRFSSAKEIRTSLACGLAGIAVHMEGSGEWEDSLNSIHGVMENEPDMWLALLDILIVVPEECANERLTIDPDVRRKAVIGFSKFSDKILVLLNQYLEETGTDRDLQVKGLRAFLSWVRQGGIPPQTLLECPLVPAAFDAMEVPALFEVCCDVASELIRSSHRISEYEGLKPLLLSKTLAVMPMLAEGVENEDEFSVARLANVFTDLGECYLSFILQGSDDAFSIVEAILLCSTFPVKDISSKTFKFWWQLSLALTQSENPQGYSENSEARLEAFKPYFARFVSILQEVMRYPEEFDNWNSDNRDKSKKYRYFAADALLDSAAVLGSEYILHMIYEQIQQAFEVFSNNSNEWQPLESALYCVRSIARKIDAEENKIMPEIMRMLPMLGESPNLRYTGTLIIGRYSEWLRKHPDMLSDLLGYVVDGLNDEKVLAASSLAFKFVCDGCCTHLALGLMDDLFAVYDNSHSLPAQHRKEIIQGITCVVSALDGDSLSTGLENIIKPIFNELSLLLTAEYGTAHGSLTATLDRLAEVFQSLNPSANRDPDLVRAACCNVVRELWPTLAQVIKVYGEDERKMEGLCRCFKYAIKASGRQFAPLISSLIDTLGEAYSKIPHSSFVYTASCCVDQFGHNAEFQAECMPSIFEHFCPTSLSILEHADAFAENPEVTEDFFALINRTLKRCPNYLFSNQILLPVMECAITGMLNPHRLASASVLSFLQLSIELSKINGPSRKLVRRGEPNPEFHETMNNLLEIVGETMVNNLVMGIAGAVPKSVVPLLTKVFESLLSYCKDAEVKVFQEWVFTALENLPGSIPAPEEKEEFYQSLFEAQNARDLKQGITKFYQACRRRRGTAFQ